MTSVSFTTSEKKVTLTINATIKKIFRFHSEVHRVHDASGQIGIFPKKKDKYPIILPVIAESVSMCIQYQISKRLLNKSTISDEKQLMAI